MSADRMPISRGIAPLADIPDREGGDGGPELVIRGEHPVIAMPVLPRRRHEVSEPVEELKWGKLDDDAGARDPTHVGLPVTGPRVTVPESLTRRRRVSAKAVPTLMRTQEEGSGTNATWTPSRTPTGKLPEGEPVKTNISNWLAELAVNVVDRCVQPVNPPERLLTVGEV
jgi:hypothetical protein